MSGIGLLSFLGMHPQSPHPPNPEDRFISARQVQARYGLKSRTAIYRALKKKDMPGIKRLGRWLIPLDELQEWEREPSAAVLQDPLRGDAMPRPAHRQRRFSAMVSSDEAR